MLRTPHSFFATSRFMPNPFAGYRYAMFHCLSQLLKNKRLVNAPDFTHQNTKPIPTESC
ncbi:MAG: hypothetical protein JSS07_04325 [Proteobacteria bacterium]|nr:hypothetical protein [Pseudomonadota bacterium]